MTQVIDRSEDQLVSAICAIIKRYGERQPVTEEDVLDCLAYVYACVQRNANSGIHPTKLN